MTLQKQNLIHNWEYLLNIFNLWKKTDSVSHMSIGVQIVPVFVDTQVIRCWPLTYVRD